MQSLAKTLSAVRSLYKQFQLLITRAGSRRIPALLTVATGLALTPVALPQANYISPNSFNAQGSSPFAQYLNGAIDNVNPINGNVFLKIPLVSFPQRGSHLRLSFYIYSNDKQWFIRDTSPPGKPPFTQGNWTGVEDTTAYDATFDGQFTVGAYVARDQSVFFGADDNHYTNTTPYGNGNCGGEPYQPCYVTTDIYGFYAAGNDGAKHYMGEIQEQACNNDSGNSICPTLYSGYATTYPATDASRFAPVTFAPASLMGSGYNPQVVDGDGVHYTSSQIIDPNGNVITTTSSGWIDSTGRQIPGSFAPPGSTPHPGTPGYPSVTDYGVDPIPGVPLASGQIGSCPAGTTSAREWDLSGETFQGQAATYYLCYTKLTYQTAFNIGSLYSTYAGIIETSSAESGNGPATLLTAVVLPDGTSYSLSYDQYLSLTGVTLPSGGSVTYTWQNVYGLGANALNGSGNMIMSRAIKTRTVTPGAGQPPEVWTYHWYVTVGSNGIPSDTTPIYAVITDPQGNDQERQIPWSSGVATSIVWYTGCSLHDTASDGTKVCAPATGIVLKQETDQYTGLSSGGTEQDSPSYEQNLYQPTTTTTTYAASNGFPAAISQTVVTPVGRYGTCTFYELGPGQSSAPAAQTVSPCYSTAQNALVQYYDFGSSGPGLLLKEVSYNYQWQQSSAYLSANLINLISSSATSASTSYVGPITGATSLPATNYTVYGFDTTSLSSSGITDSTHVAAPGGSVRGNLTFQQDLTGVVSIPASGSTPASLQSVGPSQHLYWYDTGMPASSTDFNGNSTTYIANACDGSRLSSITNPLGQTESATYDCNSGLISSIKDANQQSTTYTYDLLGRLSTVNYADGGMVTTSYPTSSSDGVTVSNTINNAVLAGQTTTTNVDGVGRPITSVLADPGGNDTTTTGYDVVGRVKVSTNPQRANSDPTAGSISYQYDALGRKVKETEQDGSSKTWHYGGNQMEWCDETGRCWSQLTDGAGRLTKVMEPGSNNTPSLVTTYTYDQADELLNVTQSGVSGDTPLTRTFTYDALKHLISADNPETGLVCYGASTTAGCSNTADGYDANGNLLAKTDARGITTSYTYDKLNRLLTKSSSGSLSSCFQYDGGEANGIGRLVNEWTQTGMCTTSPTGGTTTMFTLRSILGYDKMGRIAIEQQCTPKNCVVSSGPQLSYVYDAAGKMTSLENSVGADNAALTVTNEYDTAAHMKSVTSNWTAFPESIYTLQTSPNYGYGPVGPLYWQMGSGLTLTQSYNDRLWVNSFGATSTTPY